MSNVLCVMAHPDDETLGCGGTLAKHAEQGDKIIVAVLAVRHLRQEFIAALRVLGITEFVCLDFPDQQLDTVPFTEIVGKVGEIKRDSGNSAIVYTHHPGDLNLDHALTARAVLTAFRPKPNEKPCRIMACEVLSSTEYTYPRVFQPNWYEALVTGLVVKAQDALAQYPSEMQEWPHPRSTDILGRRASVRGSEVGAVYAEAFQLLRAGPF